MSEHRDAAELKALASDPHTDWGMLHWIAENHPELRPAVAANPGTYQELVDALGELGDPEIDAAIDQRRPGKEVSSTAAAQNPMAGMWDTATHHIPSYQQDGDAPSDEQPGQADDAAPVGSAAPVGGAGATSGPSAQTPEQAVDIPPIPADLSSDSVTHADAQESWNSPAQEPQPAAAEADPIAPPAAPSQEGSKKRSVRVTLMVGIVLIVVGALIGAFAIFGNLFGSDSSTPEPASTQEASPVEQEEEDSASEEEESIEEEATEEEATEDEVDEQELSDLRAAVVSLSDDAQCEISDDAPALAAYLEAVSTEEDSLSDDDESMLEEVFADVQGACDTSYSAGLFESVRSGSEAPEDGAGEMLNAVSTAWAETEVAVPSDAQTVSAFTAQDGNVACEFEDGVRCTVYDQTNAAPGTCDGNVSYQMQVDAGAAESDCETHVDEDNDYSSLAADEAATDGFLVCLSLDDRVTCFNSLTASGFEMSETGDYSY